MTKQVSTRDFPWVYSSLGIDTSKLGCIMLDVEPFKVTEHVLQGDADLYSSPTLPYVQGAVAEASAHVTLRYGLLASGQAWKGYVDAVLTGWVPPSLKISKVDFFPSMNDEKYACIIGHVEVGDRLQEGHDRLGMLPNLATFSTYKPHLTLAYVKAGSERKWIGSLQEAFTGKTFTVTKLNYGSKD